jgi:hypothetical protein
MRIKVPILKNPKAVLMIKKEFINNLKMNE